MRLKSVTLKNFRNFEHIKLDLHPRLTVVVGQNGAGKTALLDGIASVFTPVMTYFSSANQRLSGRGIKDTDFRVESYTDRGGKEQWGMADFAQVQAETYNGLRWDYWRPSSGSKGAEPAEKWGETALKEHVHAISGTYKTKIPALTPAFAYYGASRGHIEVPERLRGAKNNYDHPTAALVNCFDPSSDFREMLEWFDLEESSELRDNKGVVNDDYAPFQSLEAVRAAIVGLLGDFSNPHFNQKHKFVLQRKSDGATMLVNQLSQGYQSMLALVMDFARRLAIANSHLEYGDEYAQHQIFQAITDLDVLLGCRTDEPFQVALPMSAPAIMLVDEIDLHLHPSWQQRVLQDLMRTFPLTQFIVTTHSPQVLSTVRRENIRVINGDSADIPLATTYGQPSGDVMHSVQFVDPQPPINEKPQLDELTELVDTGRYSLPRVSELFSLLKTQLGEHHPQLLTLQRNIRRMEALKQ
jgi:predicted ATP-binding protein involved in virulence